MESGCDMNRENNIGFAVRRLSNIIRRDIEKSSRRLGFDPVKGVNGWAIDFFFENRDKDIFQKDFENKFSIRRSTASRILKSMEQKGLIERISVQSDARLKKIVLTDKAIQLYNIIEREIEQREQRLRKGISDEDIKKFFELIDKFASNMEEDND